MAKRKAQEANGNQPNDDSGSGSDDDQSMLDVDFEWFDPAPQDFHGIKTLLRQLLDIDATNFDLSALTDLILSQPYGSTVKCDGEESDPYAFLSVLNLRTHASVPAVQTLRRYLLSRCGTDPRLGKVVEVLSDEGAEVGLVLAERLVNMPVEIAPPMYSMLIEEIAAAREEKEGEAVGFSHYLVLSKTYAEIASELPSMEVDDDVPRRKKVKGKTAGGGGEEVFYFHPEDEVLGRYAVASGGWKFEGEGNSDARRAFQEAGIRPMGHAVLIETGKFEEAVNAVGTYLGVPAQS